MPTENERKFILNISCHEEIFCKAPPVNMWQGYIEASRGSLRFRRIETTKGKVSHVMTYKANVGERVMEIEKKVGLRDFEEIWPYCLNKLHKWRCRWHGWDIDFFRDHQDEIYFAMAEFEMPEGQLEPALIPDYIKDNLIYKVGLNESNFSSKLLSDVRYAKKLYKEKWLEKVLHPCS